MPPTPEARLVEALRARRLKLAVAESCTAGLLGARIASVPGASDAFLGGAIAYAARLKVEVLGVDEDALAKHGAVSEEVARQMARAAKNRFGADLGIAITCYAGPTGAEVGRAFVALAHARGLDVETHRFAGARDEVRAACVEAALRMALERVGES